MTLLERGDPAKNQMLATLPATAGVQESLICRTDTDDDAFAAFVHSGLNRDLVEVEDVSFLDLHIQEALVVESRVVCLRWVLPYLVQTDCGSKRRQSPFETHRLEVFIDSVALSWSIRCQSYSTRTPCECVRLESRKCLSVVPKRFFHM